MKGSDNKPLARQLEVINKKLANLEKSCKMVKDLDKKLQKIETKVEKILHEISYL